MSFSHRWLATLALTAVACGKTPPAEPPQGQSAATREIAGRDWVLVSIDDQPAEPTAPGKPVTLRLEVADVRATGHGGCNGYFASYSLRADSLALGPVGATKMFCAEGSDLERRYFEAFSGTMHYEVRDSILTLRSGRHTLTFRAASA